ncbi:MAG: hypothetical protein DMF95_12400 [Acidobacteria bacterium]|nr:MAG: hypothetical protein DMF95_12400 [Acidobacteriota bacterium]
MRAFAASGCTTRVGLTPRLEHQGSEIVARGRCAANEGWHRRCANDARAVAAATSAIVTTSVHLNVS